MRLFFALPRKNQLLLHILILPVCILLYHKFIGVAYLISLVFVQILL